jgi:cell division protein ZapA
MHEHGNVGDERLMLMAALTIADELFDARADVDELLEASPEDTEDAKTDETRKTAFG